ncbi:MAG: FxLYD domain-containing protein [Halobacteriota archaeon]|uniref:FxLYD domain-containing protein n=1 Tax=Natronomonas sp. TaxID=2184060 RepID=UPI003976B908
MRITGLDVLAMALGSVAVVFSGFVLAHSTWGGVALLVGGLLALSIAPLRARIPAPAPAVWLCFLLLLSAGIGGFLVGFGVFDSPSVDGEWDATLHDGDTGDATVVVTGTATNVGDGPAGRVTISVTLYDAAGESLDSEDVRLEGVRAGASQQFFVRFGPDDRLSTFEEVDVELSVREQ